MLDSYNELMVLVENILNVKRDMSETKTYLDV